MPVPPSDTSITSFVFAAADNDELSADTAATVDNDNGTIVLELTGATSLVRLIPTIVLADSTNCSISPESGIAQDFSDTVTYTVTDSATETTVEYSASVTNGVVEAQFGQTRRNLDFKQWYVCTTCNHAFKEGEGGLLGGKPYCNRYGCLQEQAGLRQRGK